VKNNALGRESEELAVIPGALRNADIALPDVPSPSNFAGADFHFPGASARFQVWCFFVQARAGVRGFRQPTPTYRWLCWIPADLPQRRQAKIDETGAIAR
jgi:hypothetical protein